MSDEGTLRIPPHSPAAERAVLGALISGAVVLGDIDLQEDDFFLRAHQLTYRAMRTVVVQGKPIDIVTIMEALRAAKELEDVGVETLSTLAEAGPPKHFEAHVEIVRDHAKARELHKLAQALLESRADNWREVANDTVATVLTQQHGTGRWDCSLREALNAGIESVERAYSSDGELVGIDTGYKRLNEILGGWHNSDLIVIGARPAMGKTAFLLQLALNANVPLGVVSAEMPRDQLALRCVSNLGGIDNTTLRNAVNLGDDDWPKITSALARLEKRPYWILDKPAPSLAEVVNFARRIKTRHDARILFLDYVQRLRPRDKSVPKHEQVGEIVMGLKELARELDIPVVALAQVNRDVEKRSNKRPMMGDLKHSGEIEQEADNVILLYRDEVYHEDSLDRGIAEIIIDKNRHGPVGTVKLAWRGSFMQFGELAPESMRHGYA